jgi:leader peptidase (prepilin peptidase)/N-methyltransferase
MTPMVELINGWIPPLVLAPFVGSTLGVLIERLPAGRPIAVSRSACGACGHVLGVMDLVPLLSFATSRGRCRHCGAAIAAFHVWVELAALAVAGSAVAAAWPFPGGPILWVGCALGWVLLALGWIDARSLRLPDVLTLPLVAAGLAQTFWLDPADLTDHALAAALGYTAFFLLNAAYRRLRGRDGLGLGDAKLLAAGGAWLGTAALPGALLAGALCALLWAGVLALRGTRLSGGLKLPFGPFLAAGIWLMWLLAFTMWSA